YGPFMTYAENAELRKKMYMAHMTLCTHDNENNNIPLVPRIVNLRRQLANILGYPTFADFILERRMAKDIPHVQALLHDLLEAYMPTARKELEEVTALARETEGKDYEMQPWDFSYYSHKLRMQRYNIDSEILRPYFELSKVKEGVFGLATRLYGITFHKHTDIDVYHPDVEAWEVRDKDDSYLGILYTDFHPRESKQSGAWMTTYKEQWIDEEDGRDSRPHASVTMNFTKPTETKPALLTLGEVETFLHEFGHSLHALFSQVRFESLSCTNVYWDFVELPSQFMENYATEPEFLNTFARHYETGEPMPQELIDRIIRSKNFMAAYACIRQVSLGMLDMAYYTLTDDFDADVMAFEQEAWKACRLLPQIPGTCMTTQFGHIMSGGYAAGYYSYKWAEVLDADAFSVFQEHGIFDRETATRFRDEILSRGGTEAPMTLYKRFRGGEPTIDALLKRNGIQLTVERANSRQEARGKRREQSH
ncbi:MAG: M3 family metallopeptidase, partial [Bacteroidaceae bacterium]|nr:M3 family metallopeptidase [Bacteroidaceae bacterium]